MKNELEIDGRRRAIFRAGAALGALPWFGACSGGGGVDPAASALNVAATATSTSLAAGGPPPVQAKVTGAYRPGQTYLFQSIGVVKYTSTLGGGDFSTDTWGPTYSYVDIYSGWTWSNPGGDWIDTALVPQGSTPWASFGADAVAGSNALHTYSGVDATAMVQYCQQHGRWLAVIARASGAPRAMAGTFSTLGPPPSIAVTYADGSSATLKCRMVAASTSSSTLPLTTRDSTSLPCFMEFDTPAGPVASATLAITVTEHWSGSATVGLYLCNPPINAQPVTGTAGLAGQAGAQDVGIAAVSGVIGAQRYVDGSAFTDFVIPGPASHTSEMYYDPALWGGTSDLTKWPHTAVGKWINVPANLTLVTSNYSADGFAPLVPGMGALKLVMPDGGIQTGQEVGYTGTGASNMKLFMPFDDMGLLDHIFVRYYLRLGAPQLRTPADRREVRQSGVPKWSNMDGKFGIAPSHTTSYGGTSGSSGGGVGWQMRHAWAECEAAQGGPDEAGLIPGWHLYDFQSSNPVGYRYGYEGQNQNNWGQQSGLGSVIYSGRWYCVETEIKLNSVNPTDNTFTPDGLLRTWIDGRLAYERTGMVFRTLPIYAPAYDGTLIRPFRQLGIKDLWWNWYNGGTTQSTVNRTQFVTALVWARQRIGLMK